ncbi:bifunctional glutamate N-acetyltransferase/amino-acid acetyltransferase ArgJ [Aristophania vespae]|uniref:bifunctional glutamate N-acetyltransferase/amino-acid acetyltransferase ArgJ n=1 Tax=Aristophania vespae TaxID=2697033 RepID=UPI0023519F8E|nr:bifunctional glutamate N-acetyltransferase/amino-acid acetyltransferase ArgJ [Aristophania vespae]UMM64481.1 Arginine biosynthesis bifunctional protein ArgJ [Aristophania vespae]
MAPTHSISPLALPLPKLGFVKGVKLSSVAAGVRYKGRTDLMLMEFAPSTTVAGVFTQNKCPGAPITWCRTALSRSFTARALLVNSGNANVFTGKAGEEAVHHCVTALAQHLGCRDEEIFVASTGVIGEILPYQRIIDALPKATETLQEDEWENAARAIMTTDTFPKAAQREVMIGSKKVRIQGIAKGSGMVAPDMATMLAYIVTDASLPRPVLQTLLSEGVKPSFNSITVDSDTSTSDMVMIFATGQVNNSDISEYNDPELYAFKNALNEILLDLALQVVRDGEGATKLIKVIVKNAHDDISAKKIALAIANSPLVKTAIAGEDANWGRVVMAVGKSGEPADRDRLSIAVGDSWVAKNGTVAPDFNDEEVTNYMKGQEITITADLNIGFGNACVWTCDLTHGYIDINGSYRS